MVQAEEAEPEQIEAVDSIAADELKLLRRQAAAAILEIVTVGATPTQAGRRAFALAHALGLGTCPSQAALRGNFA